MKTSIYLGLKVSFFSLDSVFHTDRPAAKAKNPFSPQRIKFVTTCHNTIRGDSQTDSPSAQFMSSTIDLLNIKHIFATINNTHCIRSIVLQLNYLFYILFGHFSLFVKILFSSRIFEIIFSSISSAISSHSFIMLLLYLL